MFVTQRPSTHTPSRATTGTSDAARLDQIRAEVSQAANLAVCLAERGQRVARGVPPAETVIRDLAAAGNSIAAQARATSAAIILLLSEPAPDPALASATADTIVRIREAERWAIMLDTQIKTAVRIHALICAELSDRSAVAEEWTASSEAERTPPTSACALATQARMLRDSIRT